MQRIHPHALGRSVIGGLDMLRCSANLFFGAFRFICSGCGLVSLLSVYMT